MYEAIARRAENAAVDVISVFHDLLYQPAIGPLLLMARATERLRLGPAALNPFTLHPYEIAGQIAMLDAVSNGRAYLGLAKGAWLDRLGLEETRPLAALREAVTIVRALLAGDESGFQGERFTLAPGTKLAYPRTRESVPLMIGTWGPETARWAGTVADEVKIGGSANPELVPVVRDWIGDSGRENRLRLRHGRRRGRSSGPASERGPRSSPISRSWRTAIRPSSCVARSRRRSTGSASPGRPKRSRAV